MAAAALPMNEIANVMPPMSVGVITASASEEFFDVDGLVYTIENQMDSDGNHINWEIRIFTDFSNISESEYEINITDAQVMEMAKHIDMGTLSDYKISYYGNYGSKPFRTFSSLSKISFADCAINSIGSGAFVSCPTLTTLELSDNIKYIGDSAFASCPLFTGGVGNKLDLKNVTEVGEAAFSGGQFTTIKFSNKMTKIGGSAFSSCTKLKEAELPSSLESLYSGAFSGCTSLEKVVFGKDPKLQFIGGSAFSDCSQLTSITVEGQSSDNTIPADKLEVFGTNMFSGCTSLQSFIWPADSLHLPSGTFRGCTKLNKVYFGDKDTGESSRIRLIGSEAFAGCTGLTEIVLPNTVTHLLTRSFSGCTNLNKLVISDGLEYISGYEVYVPIPGYDDGRAALAIMQDINVDHANCLDMNRLLSGSTFEGCTQLSIYPRSKMEDAAKNRNKYANKVILPDTLVAIPDNCFTSCTNLTNVEFGNVRSVGAAAFSNCTKLASIKIPDYTKAEENSSYPTPDYTYINDATFNGCTSLKDVEVPDNLRLIYPYAFGECKSLETITPAGKSKMNKTLQIPALTTGIYSGAFLNCSAFEYLNFDENSDLGVLGDNAFNGCSSLIGSNKGSASANNTISMPKNLISLQSNLFANCTALDRITFLGEVRTVGAYAFTNCTNLEEIIINDTIVSVDEGAFSNCTSLKEMPRTLDGKPALTNLKVINDATFKGCTSLKSAFISKNITQINAFAFTDCTDLKSVQWEEGSALNGIGASAFENCTKLELFSSKTSGTDTVIPSSVENIAVNAFSGCSLKKVKVVKPDSGERLFLGDGAFANNGELETLDLSEANLNGIPAGICTNCKELKKVILPEGSITSIGDGAFSDCYKLHTFGEKGTPEGEYVLPEGLNRIGSNAFSNNYSMQKITFPSTVTQIVPSMFNLNVSEEEIEENGYTPIEHIEVSKDNDFYSAKDGVLYNKDQSTLIVYPVNKKNTSFTVPNTVKTIGEGSMSGNNYINEIKINEGLETIQVNAFINETNLKTVEFGKNSTVAIELYAFGNHAERVTLYGPAGSSAQSYCDADSYNVVFVDNAKAAALIQLLTEAGTVINEETFKISLSRGGYVFGVVQKDKSGAVSNDNLKWSIDKNDIATVNNEGGLSFSKTGTVTLTVQNAAGTAFKKLKIQIVNEEVVDVMFGDVNGDNRVDIADVSKLMNHINGVRALTDEEMVRADVDRSTTIDVSDAATIINHINGVKALF